MILLAPHIAAFLRQRLPIRAARQQPNPVADSYAHAFRLCSECVSTCIEAQPL